MLPGAGELPREASGPRPYIGFEMSLLRRLEKALETLAEGGAERVFGGRLDLVAIGQELCNAAAEKRQSSGRSDEAPDAYQVDIGLDDHGRLLPIIEALQDRYRRALWERLREMGYGLRCVPTVLIAPREGLGTGRFDIEAQITEAQPVCVLSELDAVGRFHRLVLPATIGRGAECDVALQGKGVSRRHAQVIWDRNHFAVVDLESKNGTFVNGDRVDRGPIELGDALMIGARLLGLSLGNDRFPK